MAQFVLNANFLTILTSIQRDATLVSTVINLARKKRNASQRKKFPALKTIIWLESRILLVLYLLMTIYMKLARLKLHSSMEKNVLSVICLPTLIWILESARIVPKNTILIRSTSNVSIVTKAISQISKQVTFITMETIKKSSNFIKLKKKGTLIWKTVLRIHHFIRPERENVSIAPKNTLCLIWNTTSAFSAEREVISAQINTFASVRAKLLLLSKDSSWISLADLF